jgi:hypothetical protein
LKSDAPRPRLQIHSNPTARLLCRLWGFAFATNLGHFNATTTDGPEARHVQSAASIAARQRQYEVSFADIRHRISRSKRSSGVGPGREIFNSFPLPVSHSLLNQARPTATMALILVSLNPSTFEALRNLRQGLRKIEFDFISCAPHPQQDRYLRSRGRKVCATCCNEEGKTQAERLERAVAER